MARTRTTKHGNTNKQSVLALIQKLSNRFNLSTGASPELRVDRDVVLAAVTANGMNLQHVLKDDLRDDYNIVLAAVTSIGDALQYASMQKKADRSIVMAAVKSAKWGHALAFAAETMKANRGVALASVQIKGRSLRYCNRYFMHNDDGYEIFEVAVNKCGTALEFVPPECQTKELVLTAIRMGTKEVRMHCLILRFAAWRFRGDREVVLESIRLCGGTSLRYATPQLQADRDLVLRCVRDHGNALRYASETLRNHDREVVLEAVRNNGEALVFTSSEAFRDDREIATAGIETLDYQGGVVQFVSDRLKNDREYILQAVSKEGLSLRFASDLLKEDVGVVRTALRHRHQAFAILQEASKAIQANREIVRMAIESNSLCLFLASEELQLDPEIVGLALSTIESDQEYSLWLDFRASRLRKVYIARIKELQSALHDRKLLFLFEHGPCVVYQPEVMAKCANRLLSALYEKIWLLRELRRRKTVNRIPTDLFDSIEAYAAIQEDIQIGLKLLRMSIILDHIKSCMVVVPGHWEDFVRDAAAFATSDRAVLKGPLDN